VSQVSQARAAVEFARTQLGYATITSPISGVVSQRMVDPGDTVSPGVPVISVQADARYWLEVTVPEGFAANVIPRQESQRQHRRRQSTAEGTVVVVSPAGDAASHKFVVKVALPAVLKARSGEFGGSAFQWAPAKASSFLRLHLHDEGGLPTVFIVDKQKRREDAGCEGRSQDRWRHRDPVGPRRRRPRHCPEHRRAG